MIYHEKQVFGFEFPEIIYHYGVYQTFFNTFPQKVKFTADLPSESDFKNNTEPKLLIFDDLMTEMNEDIQQLFTRGSHHMNLTVIFVTQNLFSKNRFFRTVSLNTHYIILLRNLRDKLQIRTLAYQLAPNNYKAVLEAYDDAVRLKFGYLFIDSSPNAEINRQFHTNIFGQNGGRICYEVK